MSFQDIRGQARSINILKESLKNSCLAYTYLFCGPQGVGKTLTATTLAKAVNCQQGLLDCCSSCFSCLKIEKNQHPDFHHLGMPPVSEQANEASMAIKIEDIRQLQKDISLRPYEGKKKVFILQDAHHLTAEAANALLKILEEPPQDSLIILISSRPNSIFKTIISRCRILKFQPLAVSKLQTILTEEFGLTQQTSHFLARFCEGRIGEALRQKEKDMLGEKNRVIDAFFFRRSHTSEDFVLENRQGLRDCLNILSTWFRDIYLIKTGLPLELLINLDRKGELSECMHHYSFRELDEMMRCLSDSLLYLEQNVNIKLLFANLRLSLQKDFSWRR